MSSLLPPSAPTPRWVPTPRPTRWWQRTGVITAAVVAAGAIAAAAVGVAWGNHDRPSAAPPPPVRLAVSPAPAQPAPAAPVSALTSVAAPTGPPAAPPGTGRSAAEHHGTDWPRIIRRLETRRAGAFAAADATALARVYAPGAGQARADLAVLRRLARHGWHARGMRPTVARAHAVAVVGPMAVVRVVDALSAYDLVDRSGRVVAHAAARPLRRWTLQLVRIGGHWRIRSVRVAAAQRLGRTGRSGAELP